MAIEAISGLYTRRTATYQNEASAALNRRVFHLIPRLAGYRRVSHSPNAIQIDTPWLYRESTFDEPQVPIALMGTYNVRKYVRDFGPRVAHMFVPSADWTGATSPSKRCWVATFDAGEDTVTIIDDPTWETSPLDDLEATIQTLEGTSIITIIRNALQPASRPQAA